MFLWETDCAARLKTKGRMQNEKCKVKNGEKKKIGRRNGTNKG
jgi:hypothetical protein